MQRLRIETATEDPMHVRRIKDDQGDLVTYEDARQAIATARQQERDGTRRLGLSVEALARAARKLLDDTDEDGRSYLVDRQALESAITAAGLDVEEVLGDDAPTIPTGAS